MSTVVSDQLRALAGPELYRRNAFRITDLPTDADGRAVRERRQKVLTALSVGMSVLSEGKYTVQLGENEVRAAFEELADPRRRIVHEVFWLWGPVGDCGCPGGLHTGHDEAVRAHAQALDIELDGGPTSRGNELWSLAEGRWSRLLRRAAFWEHVRRRIAALDDRRLGEATVDELRDELPRTLVAPVVTLAMEATEPGRLARRARQWAVGDHVVEDLFLARVEPALNRIEDVLRRGGERLDASNAVEVAGEVERSLPELRRVTMFLPDTRRVRVLGDQAGLLLNNCGVTLMDRPGASAGRIRGWFDLALELSNDPEGRRLAEGNRAALDRLVGLERALAPFGVTPELAQDRALRLIEAHRFDEARALLLVLKNYLEGTATAEIDQLLRTLGGSPGPVPPPVPRTGARPAPWSPVVAWSLVTLVLPGLAWWIFGAVVGVVFGIAWVIVVCMAALNAWDRR